MAKNVVLLEMIESLEWYYISFIWENHMCCCPQAVAPKYISFSDSESIKHSQLFVLGLARTGLIFTGLQEGAQPGGGG